MLQKRKTITIQNTIHRSKNPLATSSVCEAECYICGKGLSDGYSVTAKSLPNGIVMFCNAHYSLQ